MPMQDDGYTFKRSDKVVRTPVRYKNRFGILIAADLYCDRDIDKTKQHVGLVIGPPHGGVKEQSPGVYGQEMAKRGFVALAFDPSHNGESGGEQRYISSPEIFAEDFSAGVDYLGTLPFVSRSRIGAIGICASGGFALSAAQVDTRIRAVATSAMYEISRLARNGWQDSLDNEGRRKQLDQSATQRWLDVDIGNQALTPVFPETIPANLDPITSEFFEYYVTDRGRHPRSIGGFTLSSFMSHINFGQLRSIADIAPRPILIITGEHAHSRYFSETIMSQAKGNAELHVVSGARHIDLYDRVDLIPFGKLEEFFDKSLSR